MHKMMALTLLIFRQKLLTLFDPQAITKHIQFDVQIAENQQEVPVSKSKLLQISGNLISNAIKFTPTHGKVNVLLDYRKRETRPRCSGSVCATMA